MQSSLRRLSCFAILLALALAPAAAHAGAAADLAKKLLGKAAAQGLSLPGPIPVGSTPLQLAQIKVNIPQGQDVVLVAADLLFAGPKICRATLTISAGGIGIDCSMSLLGTSIQGGGTLDVVKKTYSLSASYALEVLGITLAGASFSLSPAGLKLTASYYGLDVSVGPVHSLAQLAGDISSRVAELLNPIRLFSAALSGLSDLAGKAWASVKNFFAHGLHSKSKCMGETNDVATSAAAKVSGLLLEKINQLKARGKQLKASMTAKAFGEMTRPAAQQLWRELWASFNDVASRTSSRVAQFFQRSDSKSEARDVARNLMVQNAWQIAHERLETTTADLGLGSVLTPSDLALPEGATQAEVAAKNAEQADYEWEKFVEAAAAWKDIQAKAIYGSQRSKCSDEECLTGLQFIAYARAQSEYQAKLDKPNQPAMERVLEQNALFAPALADLFGKSKMRDSARKVTVQYLDQCADLPCRVVILGAQRDWLPTIQNTGLDPSYSATYAKEVSASKVRAKAAYCAEIAAFAAKNQAESTLEVIQAADHRPSSSTGWNNPGGATGPRPTLVTGAQQGEGGSAPKARGLTAVSTGLGAAVVPVGLNGRPGKLPSAPAGVTMSQLPPIAVLKSLPLLNIDGCPTVPPKGPPKISPR